MERTRIRLLLDYPFFGSLALTILLKQDDSVEKMAINGHTLKYNQEFVSTLTPNQKLYCYIHEICHVILGHSVRRGDRNPETWNIACDYAVNLLISDSTDLQRPPGLLFDRQYEGASAEQIYETLEDKYHDVRDNDPNEPGETLTPLGRQRFDEYEQIRHQSEQTGTVEDSLPEDNVSEEDIRSSASLINRMLTATGSPTPDVIRKLVDTFVTTKIRWQDMLVKFMSESCADRYNWLRPNKRYSNMGGVCLPSLSTNDAMNIAVVIDTSGSVDIPLFNAFMTEFKALIQSINYTKLTIISCSDRIHAVNTFHRGDELNYTIQGSGATSFAPAFEHIVNSGENPACVVYFTDLFSDSFGNSPGCPVLWVGKYTENWKESHKQRIPFGVVINMD